jgi:hypothetical protein
MVLHTTWLLLLLVVLVLLFLHLIILLLLLLLVPLFLHLTLLLLMFIGDCFWEVFGCDLCDLRYVGQLLAACGLSQLIGSLSQL